MTKIKKVEINSSEPNIILIDGEEYIMERESVKKIDGVEHSDKIIFKPYKKEEFIADLNLIVETLSKRTSKKELLREILKKTDYKSIRKLALRIKKNKKIKKQRGCLGFKIGDAYVQLVD